VLTGAIALSGLAGAAGVVLLRLPGDGDAIAARAPTPVTSGGPVRGDIDEELSVLESSGLVEPVSGSQPWTVTSDAYYAGVPSARTAKRFTISWESPVSSDGPWLVVQCHGTRQVISEFPWNGVTTVSVIVDPVRREVLQFNVSPPSAEPNSVALPQPEMAISPEEYQGLLAVRELPDGDLREIPRTLKPDERLSTLACPSGLKDD